MGIKQRIELPYLAIRSGRKQARIPQRMLADASAVKEQSGAAHDHDDRMRHLHYPSTHRYSAKVYLLQSHCIQKAHYDGGSSGTE